MSDEAPTTSFALPDTAQLNAGSLVRWALGVVVGIMISHHLITDNTEAAQLVNDLTPVCLAAFSALWITIKNQEHKQKLINAANAPKPTIPLS